MMLAKSHFLRDRRVELNHTKYEKFRMSPLPMLAARSHAPAAKRTMLLQAQFNVDEHCFFPPGFAAKIQRAAARPGALAAALSKDAFLAFVLEPRHIAAVVNGTTTHLDALLDHLGRCGVD